MFVDDLVEFGVENKVLKGPPKWNCRKFMISETWYTRTVVRLYGTPMHMFLRNSLFVLFWRCTVLPPGELGCAPFPDLKKTYLREVCSGALEVIP